MIPDNPDLPDYPTHRFRGWARTRLHAPILSRIRHGIQTRELKASKFGTRIGERIKRSDFEAFLDRRTLTGAIAATS